MGNNDTKQFISNIIDITRDEQNTIERKNVFGKIGTELYERTEWENKCKSSFNRKYKASKIVTNPPDMDTIMKTLSKLSSENNGRVLVFRNYDMANHLVFLGYKKALLDKKLGTVSTKNDITTYLAYIEQKNIVFICHKIKADSNVDQHMKNVTTSIAYFLTLYSKKIKSSEVIIIGLLIQETEAEQKLLACKFCDLFSPTDKVFESPTSFSEWWDSVETYNNWWNFSKTGKFFNLFDDLAAQILGFIEAQKSGPSAFADKTLFGGENIALNGDSGRQTQILNEHLDHVKLPKTSKKNSSLSNKNVFPSGSQSKRQHLNEHKTHVKLEDKNYTGNQKSSSKLLSNKKNTEAKTSKNISTLSKMNVSKTHAGLKKPNLVHYDDLNNHYPNGSQFERQHSNEHKNHIKL